MYAKPFSGEEKQSGEQHTMFFMEHMAFYAIYKCIPMNSWIQLYQ